MEPSSACGVGVCSDAMGPCGRSRGCDALRLCLAYALVAFGCGRGVCVRSGLVLGVCAPAIAKGSYLVDPASSHMLVSKIKPCMSKYKRLYTVKLRMAH